MFPFQIDGKCMPRVDNYSICSKCVRRWC